MKKSLMKKNKFIIVSVLFFLVLPFCLGIEIRYNEDYIKANREQTYNFFIYDNDSLVLDNTTISCTQKLFNKSGAYLRNDNLSFDTSSNSFYNNYSLSLGQYYFITNCNSSTKGAHLLVDYEVTRSGETRQTADSTTSIAITFFIMMITGTLFVLFFKPELIIVTDKKSNYLNFILRRACLVIGLYLMALNSAIMATMAGSANLPLTNEMFTYFTIFGWGGYAASIFFVFKTAIDFLTLMRYDKRKERMGDVEDD